MGARFPGRRVSLRRIAGPAVGALLGGVLGVLLGVHGDALAQDLCGPQPPPPDPNSCQGGWVCTADGWWPDWNPAGSACSAGACWANGVCDAGGNCSGGTLICRPSTPGPISGPGSSTNGSYTLTWGASSSDGVTTWWEDRYELFENGILSVTTGRQVVSASLSGRTDGTYRYNVRACNSAGCTAFTGDFVVTVLWPPGTPGAFTVPQDSGPSYTVSWTPGSGRSDRYELGESQDNINWPTTYSLVVTSKSFSKAQGSRYYYRLRACNPSGCSAYTDTRSVDVVSWLTTIAEQPPPPFAPPQQGWVGTGTIPGTPSTEGGVATYRIPIEEPPGRAGMQPDIALSYGSRNGNGVAGVGWSISGTSSIYRCPRTLAQEGANRTVLHDMSDRLCFDGQRLVGAAGAYGLNGSEYRTEVDQFARITLRGGDMTAWGAYLEVEHKSGRISQFEPQPTATSGVPDVWRLVREFDRQGNCIAYNYIAYSYRGPFPEAVLSTVVYTGTRSGNQCVTPTDARTIEFAYTGDREDKRTTYRFGVASPMTARLAAIQTKVGATPVRRYELGYKMSVATRRSLLQTVTVCGGGACGVEKLRPTTFAYQEDAPRFDLWHVQFAAVPPPGAPVTQGQTLGTDWRVFTVADFDGDGTREHLYQQSTPSGWVRYLDVTSCARSILLSDTWGLSLLRPADMGNLLASEVIDNNDGRSDVIGLSNGFLAFSKLGCAGLGPAAVSDAPLSQPVMTFPIDYDGDGVVDMRIWDGPSMSQRIVRRQTEDRLAWNHSVNGFAVPTIAGVPPQLTRDVNGDGLVDTVFDGATFNPNAPPPTQIVFFKGFDSSGLVMQGFSQAFMLSALANPAPAGAFSEHNQRRWIDVNGDGLPDIYEPGALWINQGGAIGPNGNTAMFRKVTVSMPPNPPSPAPVDPANNANRAMYAIAMDIDRDGQEEMLVPNVRTIDYCGGDPNAVVGPDSVRAVFCGADFDTNPNAEPYRGYDHSVFQWNAYKFIEQADGNYSMVLVSTDLQAPINSDLAPEDWDGDGMGDLRFFLTNGAPYNRYPGLLDTDLGPYVSLDRARAPDLLTGVTNGLGAAASWVHQPLSLPGNLQAQVSGCDMPEPFYSVHHDDARYPRSPGYVFFTSSMWTVSRFNVSNGIGTSTNNTCYRYQDAMLNSEGRGFQGFRVIVAEEQLPPAAGEDAAAGYAGCGGTCSPNNLRTTTEFNQEFPFTSKAKRVTVELAKPGGTTLAETTYWWHADNTLSPFGAWVVHPTATWEKKFDLPSGGTVPLTAETKTVTQIDSVSGETNLSCVLVGGQTPVPTSAASPLPGTATGVIKVVDTRPIENNTTIWWLGKVNSRTVLNDFFTTSLSLDENCLISGTPPQKCPGTPPTTPPRTPPTCPAVTPSSDAKVQTTNYTWYADGPPSPSVRKLNTEEIVAGGVSGAKSIFTYTDFGNLGTKTITAHIVTPDPATTYSYTPDGYFLATQTNPAGHVLTLETDPKTGLITRRQEVQNGPATVTTPDSLSRVLDVKTDGTPTVAHRMSVCAGGNCVIKRQVFQSGAPIKAEYIDRLGRVIATGAEGFDGREVITVVGYNARGAKIAEYQPWKNSSAPWLPGAWDGLSVSSYLTRYSGIDALGRVGRKDVTRGLVFETGRGDATLSTTYTYKPVANGLQTIVAVAKPVSQGGNINMSRTYDRGGKLIETTQDVSTPSPHSISAHHFYDPAGNLTMILDSAPTPNKLTAAYDNLGRKTSVVDPDRGTWTYAWDGLGRLNSQTDAKGTITSNKYDGIGRPLQRFVKTSADPAPVLESTWQYDLNGRFGTLSAMIGNENPAAGADNFRRDYLYDPFLRPFRMTTHVPAGTGWAARDFAIEYGYDHGYGRLKAMSYPGPDLNTPGEMVAFDYDSRGSLLGETALTTTGARGVTYRAVGDMSLRGQVTLQDFGNRIRETAQYDESTGIAVVMNAFGLADPPPTGCPPTSTVLVREVDYTYDHFLNLARQKKQFLLRNGTALQYSGCTPAGAVVSELYQYDELQRLLSESRSWTGMTPAPPPPQYTDQYAYDDLGNIITKDDYADLYTYGHGITIDVAGPHAVVSVSKGGVTKATFSYDPNGNLFAGAGRTITFDNVDRPIRVTLSGVTTEFHYAPDGSRYLQRTTGIPSSPSAKTVYYVDKDYERVEWPANTEEKTYIGPSVTIYRNGATRDLRYLHLDRLGSTDAVTNGGGFEYLPDAHGYDAFGKPRARDWQWSSEKLHPSGDYNVTTEHGFTKHEHLDDTYLIHMNGRMYDYRLGRFLSVDPIISNPANSQSINPYSYIGNNPLSGVDPTGYMSVGTGCGEYSRCDVDLINPSDAALRIYTPSNYYSGGGGGSNQIVPNADPTTAGGPSDTARNQDTATHEDDRRDEVLLAQATPPRGGGRGRGGGRRPAQLPPESIEEIVAGANVRVAKERVEAAGGSSAEIRPPGPRTEEEVRYWERAAEAAEAAKAARTSQVAAGGAVQYGPLNPGPLPQAVANTFRSGSYTAKTLSEATTLYRVHGGTAGQLGSFWTRTPPAGPLQSRIDLALRPEWGNTATQVTRINVPAGTAIYEGAAAAQGGLVGGGSQVFIPRVNPSWVVP